MDPLLIEQLACYLNDELDYRAPPTKDELAGMIADFLTKSGVPHKSALTAILDEYGEPVEHGDDWNPYDASGGNFDDAYSMGIRDGENYLAQRIRDLIN
jgi:hypothetical protein